MREAHVAARVMILGGFGRVGSEVAHYLLTHTPYALTLAARTPHPLPEAWSAEQRARVRCLTLDAFQTDALVRACAEADLVVSCLGPSGVVGSRVADACWAAGVPLVDAGGYDPLLQHLTHRQTREAAPVPLVINVGLLPGLSGIFPLHVLEHHQASHHTEALSVYYVGRDAWSESSAWDIIHGLGDFGQEHGFCYLKHDTLCPVRLRRAAARAEFPAPLGPQSTMLIYSEELRRLGRQLRLDTLKVYGANLGPRAAMVGLVAKVLRMYRTPAGTARAARWMARGSARDMRTRAPLYAIHVEAKLRTGERLTGDLMVADTYQATGVTLGITARYLLEPGNQVVPGVQMLHEAVPASAFFAQLQHAGVIANLSSARHPHPATAGVAP